RGRVGSADTIIVEGPFTWSSPVKSITLFRLLSPVGFALLVSCKADDPVPISPPVAATCPSGLPFPATCSQGTSRSGAPYLIAMPSQWNGKLVVFLRGATPVPFDSLRALGAARFLLG